MVQRNLPFVQLGVLVQKTDLPCIVLLQTTRPGFWHRLVTAEAVGITVPQFTAECTSGLTGCIFSLTRGARAGPSASLGAPRLGCIFCRCTLPDDLSHNLQQVVL